MTAEAELRAAAQQLNQGGVVAAATESSFGLLARVDQPGAIDRLFQLKPREPERGVPLIAPDVEAWRCLVAPPPDWALALTSELWPGPLTVACRAQPTVDERLCEAGTVAVRVPGDCPAARLARLVGGALTATSCNAPGSPPAERATDVPAALGGGELPAWCSIVAHDAPGGPPSTIVVGDGKAARIVREGGVPARVVKPLLERSTRP